MRSKELLSAAAVADENEVQHLNHYLAERILSRTFSKAVSESTYGLKVRATPVQNNHQLCPFHSLRTDLTLLLGASGSKLLENTWSKHRLSPTERDPAKLRPCLVKLFSVAARIAATKGVGHALKRVVSDFEKTYFPVVDHEINIHRRTSRRFALLSVLQCGQGGHLLHGILDDPEGLRQTVSRARDSFPSGHIEQDPTVARRQFLFEAAYRSKSWSEAYRQARILKALAPNSARHRAVNRRLGRVFEGLMSTGFCKSKKKQFLTDLAAMDELSKPRRMNFTLDALSSRAQGCRPGEIEEIALDLMVPGDPWWRVSLNRLYRHQAVPNRWMEDLRTLCQAEENLRGFSRVVMNILRYSGARAQVNLSRNGLRAQCFPLDANQARARLGRVREAVREWQALLPPAPMETSNKHGASVELSPEQWKFLSHVCHTLGTETPLSAVARFQAQPVRVSAGAGHSTLEFSPDFFQCSEPEQRFLLARAVFRKAGGLDLLERRAAWLDSPENILKRALDYAEWSGHNTALLDEFREKKPGRDLVKVALEEVYWQTRDPVYQKLAVICHQGGWCPLFDREADLFAACFADLVSASQALVKTSFWGKQISRTCSKEGLNPLFQAGTECPVLCLRLQTLWFAVADEIQRESPSPNKVLG